MVTIPYVNWLIPARLVWLVVLVLLLVAGVALLRGIDALRAGRRASDLLERDLDAQYQPRQRWPRYDDTITDAEIARLIHDAAWQADREILEAEAEQIDRWLAAGCPPVPPWGIARLEP